MQLTILYLRLKEELHSPLPPAEVVQRMQQATIASTASDWPTRRGMAPLFQGWVKADSFRISAFLKDYNQRRQSSVVVEGEVVAEDIDSSRLRLLYRPLLMQLFVLGFWLIFWGTLALASLLEWLRGPDPAPSFPWQSVAVPCVIYGLTIFFFWRGARKNRQQLVSLLELGRPDAPSLS